MHAGKLQGNNAANRVWGVLCNHIGTWLPIPDIARLSATVSTSTRISELRHQLPAGYRIEHTWKNPNDGEPRGGSWYRLMRASV